MEAIFIHFHFCFLIWCNFLAEKKIVCEALLKIFIFNFFFFFSFIRTKSKIKKAIRNSLRVVWSFSDSNRIFHSRTKSNIEAKIPIFFFFFIFSCPRLKNFFFPQPFALKLSISGSKIIRCLIRGMAIRNKKRQVQEILVTWRHVTVKTSLSTN